MTGHICTIRPFTPADQEAARALILAGLGEHWGFIDETLNPDLNDIEAAYPPETAIFLVAEGSKGTLLGTGCVYEEDAETVRLVRMSVASAARGRGIARGLLAELENTARQRGYRRIVLETTEDWTDAIALYRATGFTELGIWDGDCHFEKRLDETVTRPGG